MRSQGVPEVTDGHQSQDPAPPPRNERVQQEAVLLGQSLFIPLRLQSLLLVVLLKMGITTVGRQLFG